MKTFLMRMKIDEQEIADIFERLEQAQQEIFACYNELKDIGVVKLKRADSDETFWSIRVDGEDESVTKAFLIRMKIDEQQISDIFGRLEQAQREISACYRELEALGIVKMKSTAPAPTHRKE